MANGRCHGIHFLDFDGCNFGSVTASGMKFDSRGVLWVKLADEDIDDFEVPRDVAMATIMGLNCCNWLCVNNSN